MKLLKLIFATLCIAFMLSYSAPSNATQKIILYSWSEVSAFCGEPQYQCTSIVETRDNGEEFWVIYNDLGQCAGRQAKAANCPPPGRGD